MKMKLFFLPLITVTLLYNGFVSAEISKHQLIANHKQPKDTEIIKKSEWKIFTPPDKSFQVLMPGRPKTDTQIQKTRMGEINIEIFAIQPPEQEVAYLVTYNEFPYSYAKMTSPQKILNDAKANTLITTQSNLISSRNIRSSNGHPGLEIKYIDSVGKVTTNRMYVAEGRLYQVIAIVSRKQRENLDKTITGYLNSFQVVLRR
ncbi:MAG: hypothetical protein EAZ76_16390 [Nostocales cyanobacterium]|nr:MAG: hypothetical protein EAZ87_22495 [Nostocales cyanobacterium]TAF09273.1 MAG: hypothetical protein EAZ76_16390 [Nostocales cyanobacterium]